jgi:hypothetical protein
VRVVVQGSSDSVCTLVHWEDISDFVVDKILKPSSSEPGQ